VDLGEAAAGRWLDRARAEARGDGARTGLLEDRLLEEVGMEVDQLGDGRASLAAAPPHLQSRAVFLLFGRGRGAIIIRVLLAAALVVLALALHLHGTTLLIVRLAVIVAIVLVFAAARSVRSRSSSRDDR
jgi:hypothetical protein